MGPELCGTLSASHSKCSAAPAAGVQARGCTEWTNAVDCLTSCKPVGTEWTEAVEQRRTCTRKFQSLQDQSTDDVRSRSWPCCERSSEEGWKCMPVMGP